MPAPKKLRQYKQTSDIRDLSFKEIVALDLPPDATVHYALEYSYNYPYVKKIYFSYFELESDEEYEERLKREAERRKEVKKEQKEKEVQKEAQDYYAEYLRLKAKFDK